MIALRPALQAYSHLDAYAQIQIQRAGVALFNTASGANESVRRSDLEKLRDFAAFALKFLDEGFEPDEEREGGYGPFNQINL